MKKEILKEIACYAGCIVFILLSGYFSGFFKDTSFAGLSNSAITMVKASGIEQYINQERSSRKKVTVYRNYRPRIIPDNVLRGAALSNSWKNVFNANKKVIFYIYDGNDDFNSQIQKYFYKNQLQKYYNLEAYEIASFNRWRLGAVGPEKICDSLEECNRVREKASGYTLMMEFLSNCGKTVCIIDSGKNQYVQLKRRNITDTENMIVGLKNW